MDFDQSASDKNLLLTDAILPESIKKETKNWNTIKGYIYIISKKFKAFPSDPDRLLMKIGFSDFFTDHASRTRSKTKANQKNTQHAFWQLGHEDRDTHGWAGQGPSDAHNKCKSLSLPFFTCDLN